MFETPTNWTITCIKALGKRPRRSKYNQTAPVFRLCLKYLKIFVSADKFDVKIYRLNFKFEELRKYLLVTLLKSRAMANKWS